MFVYEDGEVVGGEVLNLAVVAGALFVILAALWSPGLPTSVLAPQVAPVEQVVVVAHSSHAT